MDDSIRGTGSQIVMVFLMLANIPLPLQDEIALDEI